MKWILSILGIGVLAAASYAQTSTWLVSHQPAAPALPGVNVVTPWVQVCLPRIRTAPAPVIQAAPIIQQSQVISVPNLLTLQVQAPTTSYRWGFFKRRLIPRTTYQPGAQVQYQLMQPTSTIGPSSGQ